MLIGTKAIQAPGLRCWLQRLHFPARVVPGVRVQCELLWECHGSGTTLAHTSSLEWSYQTHEWDSDAAGPQGAALPRAALLQLRCVFRWGQIWGKYVPAAGLRLGFQYCSRIRNKAKFLWFCSCRYNVNKHNSERRVCQVVSSSCSCCKLFPLYCFSVWGFGDRLSRLLQIAKTIPVLESI